MGVNKILLVEGDDVLRNALVEQLRLEKDILSIAAKTGEEALAKFKEARFDLLIIELSLPDMDGRELCRRMRWEGAVAPEILFLGADTEDYKISSTQAEPNDYITKPFRLGSLLALIYFKLRKREGIGDTPYSLGPYRFHPASKSLLEPKENKNIRLTEKETSILNYLFRSSNSFVGRGELLNEVWGYDSGVTTHTLETHVYRLRQKLEPDPSNAQILVTEPGGYRLIP